MSDPAWFAVVWVICGVITAFIMGDRAKRQKSKGQETDGPAVVGWLVFISPVFIAIFVLVFPFMCIYWKARGEIPK